MTSVEISPEDGSGTLQIHLDKKSVEFGVKD